MKNFIILCAGLLFLTGCPSEQEVKETTEGLLEKKTIASNSINSNDFSLEGLLKTHDYFFDFGEKVHLMKEDEKVRDAIKQMIKNNGAKTFCNDFLMPVHTWQVLDNFCQSANGYKCSLDIKEYPAIQSKFYEIIGDKLAQSLKKETECN